MRIPLQLKNSLKNNHTLGPVVAFLRDKKFRSWAHRMVERDLPNLVIVELTNHCNLRCAKCPTYDAKRGRGFMSEATFDKILSDISKSSIPTRVGLNGAGEALLHPDFLRYARKAKQSHNVEELSFITNGLGLTPEMSRELLESGLDHLKVSLDTNDAAVFLKYNRVDGYSAVVDNVIEFCRQKRAGNYSCNVNLKITLYKDDKELVEKMRRQWLEHVDAIRVTKLHNWLGLRGKRKGVRTAPCEMIWAQIQILWDGQMTLCCFDNMEGYYNMGNVNTADLSQYWKADSRLNEIRKDHLNGDFSRLPICADCNTDTYETLEFFEN